MGCIISKKFTTVMAPKRVPHRPEGFNNPHWGAAVIAATQKGKRLKGQREAKASEHKAHHPRLKQELKDKVHDTELKAHWRNHGYFRDQRAGAHMAGYLTNANHVVPHQFSFGADDWRTHTIQTDPMVQHVDKYKAVQNQFNETAQGTLSAMSKRAADRKTMNAAIKKEIGAMPGSKVKGGTYKTAKKSFNAKAKAT